MFGIKLFLVLCDPNLNLQKLKKEKCQCSQNLDLYPTCELCDIILHLLPAKTCQSRLSLLISHRVNEKFLMSVFR